MKRKNSTKVLLKSGVSIALSAVIAAGGLPGAVMHSAGVAYVAEAADEEAAQEQCPTPEIYQPEGTVSLEGWMLATSSNNIKFGVDVNKNGGTRTSGYTYYYTTDGTEPSATNGKKTNTPYINSSTSGTEVDGIITYKVIATKEGMKDSEVVTYTFKKKPTDKAYIAYTDKALKSAIMKELNLGDDLTTPITQDDMKGLTKFVAENAGITELTGLQYAENLTELDLSGNDLSGSIKAFANKLEDYPLNKLVRLDLSNCHLGKGHKMDNDLIYLTYSLPMFPLLETVDLSDNEIAGNFEWSIWSGNFETCFNLKTLDLSNNDLWSFVYNTQFMFDSLEKIDLSGNRMLVNENGGDWYAQAVKLGLEKYDLSNQKSLADIRATYLRFTDSGWNYARVDTENNIIDFGDVVEDTIQIKFLGYADDQVVSVLIGDAQLPVKAGSENTYATDLDSLMYSLKLNKGENSIKAVVSHLGGETKTYTIKANCVGVPSDSSVDGAGIKDPVLQQEVCKGLNALAEYKDNPLDYRTHTVTKEEMSKLTSINFWYASDLSGLEYATNITSIRLSQGTFTGEFDVSRLTKLKSLELQGGLSSVKGLENCTALTTLSLQSNTSAGKNMTMTSVPGVENLTNLTSLTLDVPLDTAPDLTKLTKLKTLWISAGKDGSMSVVKDMPSLTTLKVLNCGSNLKWINPENTPLLNRIIIDGYAGGELKLPSYSNEVKNLTYAVTNIAENADVTIDVSELSAAALEIKDSPNAKVTLTGSCDRLEKIDIESLSELSFTSAFATENLTTLKENKVLSADVPKAEQIPEVTVFESEESTSEDGIMPEELSKLTKLTSFTYAGSGITSLGNYDFSKCENLTEINLKANLAATDEIDGAKLPASLQTLYVDNSGYTRMTGDWSHMTSLSMLFGYYGRFIEFPSVIGQLPSLSMAMLQGNQYSSIPEHTFDNASNLTYLTLGDWLPVVKTDNGWELDPQSESGRAIAKLKEVSPNVTCDISVGNGLGITNGQYCGLTAISASTGTVVGTPMQERNLSLMVPTGSKSVTITPQALLSDTVITVNGKEYKSGDSIEIELPQMTTNVEIKCSNPYTNYKNYDTETTYTLTILAGEYMENFVPEEGHYYNIDFGLKKIDGTTSMADQYFNHTAVVKYSEGKYEVRFTTIAADMITDMKYKDSTGTEQRAEILYEDGKVRTYRIQADSIEQLLEIIPRVSAMGNVYTSCWMKLDLTKAVDITAAVGADKADLNSTINKALEITKKNNIYTDESYSAFTAALEEAQKIAVLSAATQQSVDDAAAALKSAIEGLKADDAKLANKSALKVALDEAKAVEKGNHTETAWATLQNAIADAQTVYDTLEATQTEVDSAVKVLNMAVTLFNNSGDSSKLDKDNLEDGEYTVSVDMIKTDRSSKSMADNAIGHTVKLEVKDGQYYVTLDFKGMSVYDTFGYLKSLSYYKEGYTYNQYGIPTGELADAQVLTTQKNEDGTDIIDQYNDKDSLYPDLVKIPLVKSAIADEYVPLHVFVPVMEAIAEGNGDQDVLMKIDWSTLKKSTGEDPVDPTPTPTPTPVPSDVTLGDVDLDGKVELDDAVTILKAALGIISLDGDAAKAADVDGNGEVNLTDALLTLKYALGIITEFSSK